VEPGHAAQEAASTADETGALLQALEDPDPFVRTRALGGLAGRPGVDPALVAALGDDYPMVRREAVRALRHARGSPAAQALVDVVSHDPSAEVREEAVSALAELLQRGASEGS
jgi:HEAT repeat protein